MQQKIYLLIVFSFLIISQFACKITNNEDSNVDIDAVFNLDMIENLQKDGELNFIVTAVEEQTCENATIDHRLEALVSRLDLSLNEIISPADCNPGQSFASTYIPIENFSVSQTKDILFRLKNTIENIGELKATDDFYELTLNTKDGFDELPEKLWRVPTNFLWGYIAYNTANVIGDAAENFQTELTELSNTIAPSNGYYGHFSIAENNSLELRQAPDFSEVETFFFNFEGDNQSLIDLLESYRMNISVDEAEFRIYRADGSVL